MTDSSNDRTSQLERAEHYIYLAAGYILVFAAAGLLVAAIIEMVGSIMDGKYTTRPWCICWTVSCWH
ncbi:MAG: hypothetical protein WBM52_22110 [Thiogranum sp.]